MRPEFVDFAPDVGENQPMVCQNVHSGDPCLTIYSVTANPPGANPVLQHELNPRVEPPLPVAYLRGHASRTPRLDGAQGV